MEDEELDQQLDQIIGRITDHSFGGYYRDEFLTPQSADVNLPGPLKIARALAESAAGRRLSRAQLFFEQAKMLADYEDDFDYPRDITRYYPTYQSLTNKELRAYFSWRTRWRKGIKEKTSLSYAFIYIYELIHAVGCADAKDAYSKLTEFSDDYSLFDPYINTYLKGWLRDFIVYYGLNPSLLADTEEIRMDNAVSVLLKIHEKSDDDIFQAAVELSGNTLKSSRLTKKYPNMLKAVVVGTLREVADHYAQKCQNSWIDHYFGYSFKSKVWFFAKAVFCYQKSDGNYEIELSPICRYQRIDGQWYSHKFQYIPECRKRFLDLLRTIDSIMRKAVNFPYLIQQKVTTKWIIKTIEEEIRKWRDLEHREEVRKKEVHFDLSKLGDIRSDSEVTRDKLLTDEEIKDSSEISTKMKPAVAVTDSSSTGQETKKSATDAVADAASDSVDPEYDPSNDNVGFDSLSSQEKRYLQCLLNGISVNWVTAEGLLPSLLCDSINDKLYCLFEDTVLEDGTLIEDYTEELKKGLCL